MSHGPATSESPGASGGPGTKGGPSTNGGDARPQPSRTVIEGAAVVTVDAPEPNTSGTGTEYTEGHVVIEDGRISAVGPGAAPSQPGPVRRVDGSGCLLTPGLVNTHHHLYQWATRGYAVDATLFGWLTELYPVWAGIDEELTGSAAAAGLGWTALSGCTTVADHHYVFPDTGGDVLGGVVSGAERIGVRLHAVRGSMDRGQSAGGLPPDSAVEDTESALRGTEDAIRRFHDPAFDSRVRVAVGPCSPFSVSGELMRSSAELARRHGVRLHTHLAETIDELERCDREFGCDPVDYAERLGWLGEDVWLAHGVHLSERNVARLGETGTGVAHCPSSNGRLGAGTAPVRPLLDHEAPVGLGIDGVASNESGRLGDELHQALLLGRARYGPDALSVRDALWMGTRGGARCLGREDELGSLEPGKLADIALWDLDGLGHAGIGDPVAALALGPLPRLRRLLCGGETVVADARLVRESERDLTAELRRSCSSLAAKGVG